MGWEAAGKTFSTCETSLMILRARLWMSCLLCNSNINTDYVKHGAAQSQTKKDNKQTGIEFQSR